MHRGRREMTLTSTAAGTRLDRVTHLGILGLTVAWLLYTRLYFVLHPAHLTFDPSLFMWVTGKPDPTCGLTRTFAWMWRGDVGRAVAAYPLGPLVFVLVLALGLNSAAAVVTGRRVRLVVRLSTRRALIMVAVVALLANWIAKLVWLGT
jgi:Protein of unknown function (DUF2752)